MPGFRLAAPAFIFAFTGAAAMAVEIDLPGEEQRIEASYGCGDGKALQVEFINIGDNRLAVIRIDEGDPVVFVNVVSASGARYAARAYQFWDIGTEATFTDADGSETDCSQQ